MVSFNNKTKTQRVEVKVEGEKLEALVKDINAAADRLEKAAEGAKKVLIDLNKAVDKARATVFPSKGKPW